MEKTILIVDNDVFSSKILSKLLSNLYRVIVLSNADDALNEIQKGLTPDVVMSTRILKGTDGIDFLNKISTLFPNSFRVLITSEKDPKALFEMVNQSHVNLFLTKPFNNLQVLQMLKLGINATNDTKIVNQENNSEEEFKYILKTISNLIISSETFYFRPHTYDLIEICKSASDLFKFNEEQKKNLFYATLLHNHYLVGSPDLFKVSQPDDLPDSIKSHFFNHFTKSYKNIAQYQPLEKYINFASMMFEHIDGSGNPNKITGFNIPKEIQFLILLNLYHNLVYRLNKNELEKLKFEGRVVQTKAITFQKHQQATTYLFQKLKWFDHDMFYKFQELIKKRDINGLKFNNHDLILEMNENVNVVSFLREDDKLRYLRDMNFNNKSKVIIKNENGDIQSNFVEEKISIRNLKVGDITTMPINDYKDKLIVPAFFEHTEESIESLTQQLKDRFVSEVIYRKTE